MRHFLKIDMPYYYAVRDKRKTFKIRFNDRGFNAGDDVILIPYTELGIKSAEPSLQAKIGYVTGFQQKEGYVVFSIKNVRQEVML